MMMFKLFLFVILFPIICTAQDSSFHKAMASYKAKDYPKAIELFSLALKEQPDQPEILFNLGLAWQKAENKAMPIALWRKTLTIDPSYSKAKKALDFVQRIAPARNTLWEKYRAGFLRPLPFNLILALLFISLVFLGFSLINYLGLRKKAQADEFAENPGIPLKTTLWGLVFLITLIITLSKSIDNFESRGTVINVDTSLLVSPNKDSLELSKVQAGLEVIMNKSFDNWVQIKIPGGPAGWIRNEEIFQTQGRQL